MTTKPKYRMLPYNREGEIDFSKLLFDPHERLTVPDAMIQNPIMLELMHVLNGRFRSNQRPDIFLDSNTYICYDRRDLNVRVGPDCYVAFGVDAQAIRQRRLYLPWEVGKPPDFVMEVASPSTSRQDLRPKRDIYASIGIPEYWRVDPTGGDLYGQPLAGDRLVEGAYRPIELTTEPDGVLKGYSPAALALSLCWRDEWLYLYDPETGQYLMNIEQALDAYAESRADLHEERAAREAAQSRVRELEEEVRRLRSDN